MKISFFKIFSGKEPKINEIWTAKRHDDGNPFPKTRIDAVKINDVKSGWIKFDEGYLYLNNPNFSANLSNKTSDIKVFLRVYRFHHVDGDKQGLEDWNKSI